ncbi:hypothetical protein D3C76_1464760 [compost metagenome]
MLIPGRIRATAIIKPAITRNIVLLTPVFVAKVSTALGCKVIINTIIKPITKNIKSDFFLSELNDFLYKTGIPPHIIPKNR